MNLDGASADMDHIDFHNEYSMSQPHMDDLNPFYAAHPGLSPGDVRHDKSVHTLLQQGADPTASLPMSIGPEMLNSSELFNQQRLHDHQHAWPHVEPLLHERLEQMREHSQDPAALHQLESLIQRANEQRSGTPLGFPRHDEMFDQNKPPAPPASGPVPGFSQQNEAKSDERLPNVNSMQPYPPYNQQKSFAPLDASAITPASVFSTISSTSTNDFLSPLTSPALQPQGSQQSFHTAEQDPLALQQDMLSTMSSPSHPNVRAPYPGGGPHPYDRSLFGQSELNSLASDASTASDRSSTRRNRSTTAETKANKMRPSPLMKPSQSPKVGPGSVSSIAMAQVNNGNVAGLRKRSTTSSHTSPSLGTLESLSSTMQEASGLAMPSPAAPSPTVSPALVAMGGHSGSSTPRSLPHGRHSSLSHRSKSKLASAGPGSESGLYMGPMQRKDSLGETNEADNSPSPIDLANNDNPVQRPAKPATPGTIMGIVNHSSPQKQQTSDWASQEAAQEAAQGSHAPHANENMSPGTSSSFGYPSRLSTPNSFPQQNAVNAVAASALINVSQARPNVFFQGSQPKPILPGGLSSEDRNAWMNLRRVGNGGLDQRRTSHKAAEQKRRDSLKHCFDELRGLIPAITLDESVPGGSVLGPDGSSEDQLAEGFDPETTRRPQEGEPMPQDGSRLPLYVTTPEQARDANRTIAKVLLLRHSNEYLVRLKHRIERRDAALHALSQEVVRLRGALAEARGEPKDTSSVSKNFDSLTLANKQAQSSADASVSQGGAEPAPETDTPGVAAKMETS